MKTSPCSFASSSGSRVDGGAAAAWEGNRSRRDGKLEPALDQRRLIGEDRVTCEVLEGHRSVEGDRQLQSGQRRTAEVEKVIPSADLVLGDAEHLRPRGRQPVLVRRTRPLVVLLGGIEFCGERRQRLPVDLAVVRQ